MKLNPFVLFPLAVLFVAACTGPSQSTETEPEITVPIPVDSPNLLIWEEAPGYLYLGGPTSTLVVGDLIELVPDGPWPGGGEERPGQAMAMVTRVFPEYAQVALVGQRDAVVDFDSLVGRRVEEPGLELSKTVTLVTARDGRYATLAARAREGVQEGDFFFILGEPATEPERFGSRIIALVRVVDLTPSGSQVEIVHEMSAFDVGALALFGHHTSPSTERPEALILFAQTQRDVVQDNLTLPVLASAVMDYQFEFRFSNIRIETLDVFVDPAEYNAPENAQDLAPSDGFGVIVFGEERPDEFLYNIATYGTSPSLATTVGILPGGLPLEAPDGLEGLSAELAPSFLATAMTQRGDHAESIYFLEYCLRHHVSNEGVRYHLREHLALRYESIGRPYEGLWMMTDDIRRAQADDNPYPVLNALSIREYLNGARFEFELELADLTDFLDVAQDVLPDESLIAERLEQTQILGRLARWDEALELIEHVILQAQRQNSLRWEVSAALARARLLYNQGDVLSAIERVTAVLSNARLLGLGYPRYCHIMLAQYFAELGDVEQSLANLAAALSYAATDANEFPTGSTHELAATLYFNFNQTEQAADHMAQAAEIYVELDLHGDTARALLQLGMLEMNQAVSTGDPTVLDRAYAHMDEAANLFLGIGDGSTASQGYAGMGLVSLLLRNGPQASADFARTIELAIAYNDPATVVVAYQRSAELQASLGHIAQAQTALQAATLWAETFQFYGVLEELDALERRLRNEI